MIEFSCPKCATNIKIGDESAGRAGKCKTCGSRIVVPSPVASDWLSENIPPPIAHQLLPPATSYGSLSITPKRPIAKTKSKGLIYSVLGFVSIVVTFAIAFVFAKPSIFNDLFSPRATTSNAELVPTDSTVATVADVKTTPEPTKHSRGKLRMLVTWQFNDFVGTKPDVGALVFLLHDPPLQKLAGIYGLSSGTIKSEYTAALLAADSYLGVCGGDGRCLIDKIPAGRWKLMVISQKANADPRILEEGTAVLTRYFENPGILPHKKIHFENIVISEDEEIEMSHDFGNTAL